MMGMMGRNLKKNDGNISWVWFDVVAIKSLETMLEVTCIELCVDILLSDHFMNLGVISKEG